MHTSQQKQGSAPTQQSGHHSPHIFHSPFDSFASPKAEIHEEFEQPGPSTPTQGRFRDKAQNPIVGYIRHSPHPVIGTPDRASNRPVKASAENIPLASKNYHTNTPTRIEKPQSNFFSMPKKAFVQLFQLASETAGQEQQPAVQFSLDAADTQKCLKEGGGFMALDTFGPKPEVVTTLPACNQEKMWQTPKSRRGFPTEADSKIVRQEIEHPTGNFTVFSSTIEDTPHETLDLLIRLNTEKGEEIDNLKGRVTNLTSRMKTLENDFLRTFIIPV